MAIPAAGSQRVQQPHKLNYVNLSNNVRIPALLDMVRQLTCTDDAQAVLDLLIEAMGKVYGQRCMMTLLTQDLPLGHFKISRLRTCEGVDEIKAQDPWNGQDVPVRSGGFLADVIRTPEPKVIHNLGIRNDPVVGDCLINMGSLAAAPLFAKGRQQDWVLMFHPEPQGSTSEDLEQLILRANLIRMTVRNIQVAQQLKKANAWIEREVDSIAEIQRAFLPQPIPRIPGLVIAASYETFDRAGGDYYNIFPLTGAASNGPGNLDGRWGFMIADASGHGPSAAVVVAMLHAILRAYPDPITRPAEVLEYLNRQLLATKIGDFLVTAFFATYDPDTRQLTYARAGHNPPLLKTPGAGQEVQLLDQAGGIPLGVFEKVGSDEASITLAGGQTLVLYTDGITEAFSPSGTMFGTEGIERAVTDCTGEPACVVSSVTGALKQHQAGQRPADDQTLVAVHVKADR